MCVSVVYALYFQAECVAMQSVPWSMYSAWVNVFCDLCQSTLWPVPMHSVTCQDTVWTVFMYSVTGINVLCYPCHCTLWPVSMNLVTCVSVLCDLFPCVLWPAPMLSVTCISLVLDLYPPAECTDLHHATRGRVCALSLASRAGLHTVHEIIAKNIQIILAGKVTCRLHREYNRNSCLTSGGQR
jgi:hypothetical protein